MRHLTLILTLIPTLIYCSRGNSRPSSADYTRPRSSSPYLSSGNTSYGVGAGAGGRGGASGGANRLGGRPPPLVPPYSSSSSPTGAAAAAAANRRHSQSQERETERVRDGGGGDYRQGTRPIYPYPSSSQTQPIYQPNHHQQQQRSGNINSASSSPRMTTGRPTLPPPPSSSSLSPRHHQQPLNQHQHQHQQQQQWAASAATAVGVGVGLRGGGAMGSERPWAVKASIDPPLVTLPYDGGRGGGHRELINLPASERSSSPGDYWQCAAL